MRTRPVDALFPATRKAILSTLLLRPERWWYLSQLTAHLGRRNPSSLQRELESLVEAEILVRRQEGNRVCFRANRDCPIFPELATLFVKTAGLVEIVQQALNKWKEQIRVAFIYGSIARSDERAASDIDLLIVGDLGLSDIAPGLRIVEEQIGRAVNAAVYSESEFVAKLRAGHHFLGRVIEGDKLFLIGSQHELEELAHGRPSAPPHHEQAGTR